METWQEPIVQAWEEVTELLLKVLIQPTRVIASCIKVYKILTTKLTAAVLTLRWLTISRS